MTDDEAKIKARQQAAEDLEDINALKQATGPFQRYWMRHLRLKREAMRVSFENDPPDKCSHEEREIRRRILKSYDELLGMMAQHEASARAVAPSG
jgi:hypothetical protein